ncbi:putative virion structural protein [Erwinia phage PhiEaH1]|jgi:hypothetical protein|uniref:Putative virion structural protein n=1 Tax=Erwinia phage PhiEaH1 TaxID=1401669 RepID=W8D0H2_9CAUD|nr:putative virion structural protein [Erwinia phage PhiEaH1]AGX01808.1 putative virion structural protein [Erwinia phage PhiEaH1]
MFIDLSWTDLNSVATKLEIFRGDAPLDRLNLPSTPIATLTNGETSYRDESNILLGKDYYYVFVNTTATDRIVSQNYKINAVTRRGPGPQKLKQGDNSLGYFGTIQSGEFVNGSEFVDLTGVKNFASGVAVLNPFPIWHKFVRNNKVLIIPEGPIASTASWLQLYQAGMVYGTDDNGPMPPAAPVKQSAKITIGKDVFRVRLLKGMTDQAYTDYPATVLTPNEWNDLVYPLGHAVPADQRLENIYLNGKSTSAICGAGNTSGFSLVQELATISSASARGQAVSNDDTAADTSAYIASRTTVTTSSASASYYWYPVLELVEG